MILGIVGHEAAKFTEIGEQRARDAIRRFMRHYEPTAVSSGHCHLGGIDIWTEEEARRLNYFDPAYIFPPANFTWERGFKPRNIRIAQNSDIVVSIVVDRLPVGFKGMTHKLCYHCARHSATFEPHVKSGGCWTMHYAREIGKRGELFVINNGVETDDSARG